MDREDERGPRAAEQTEALIRFLSDPASYGDGTTSVERIETHMAYVFLTDAFAWKLKKPVRYEFLDFSTLDLRRRVCEDEVRLNRRLAPATYLGTVPVVCDAAGVLHLGPVAGARTVDWLVHMRRLPRGRMLDRVIRAGGPSADDVTRLGAVLVAFYGSARRESMPADVYLERLGGDIEEDIDELTLRGDHLPEDLIAAVGRALRERLAEEAPLLRPRARRIVEAHGDLRPEHICMIVPPVIIDALEFRRDFRLLDPADELAFLGMECERLGNAAVGRALLRIYERDAGDDVAPSVTGFYMARRALLRSRIAIWHLRNGTPGAAGHWSEVSREYLELAARHAGAGIGAGSTVRP